MPKQHSEDKSCHSYSDAPCLIYDIYRRARKYRHIDSSFVKIASAIIFDASDRNSFFYTCVVDFRAYESIHERF